MGSEGRASAHPGRAEARPSAGKPFRVEPWGEAAILPRHAGATARS